jgi:hypothetical protein
MPRHSPFTIHLTPTERHALERLARQYTAPYRDVVRARLVLFAADGWRNDQIADRLDLPRQIVSKWRKRFAEHRLAGLIDEPRQPVAPPRGGRRAPAGRVPPSAASLWD